MKSELGADMLANARKAPARGMNRSTDDSYAERFDKYAKEYRADGHYEDFRNFWFKTALQVCVPY